MEPLTGIPGNDVGNHQMRATPISNSEKSVLAEDKSWPLSGKPYFTVIVTKSQVKGSYQLSLPTKISRLLPSNFVPVVLTYGGKKWDMVYLGDRPQKRLDPTWKTFVHDNNMKIGDACVFELEECSSEIIKFRVQILRGDFPLELLERVNGNTSNTPIIIE